ncbi:serine hydrolase domain-containing protein [Aquimarina litoralis]|uniref:serine hydrolase domain-containing protein n=1 Tax=Aquimarina litoralis TaxID=584605 RepID=UPI001C575F77|nr:serine hydrolase domain-containing protein [Aquimarina litoralis]MBW1297311.1 serine hydrolase [Aquimarina litoralis]
MKLNFSLVFFFVFYISNAQDIALKKIDSIIESKIKETDPGLMVGIVKDGKTIYEKYYGLANLQHQVKVDEKTRSNIASTAKQFTALMILDLALRNKLSLEDDLRKYLPDLYKNIAHKIKIRQIINHTSGIRDYVELLDLEGMIWWKRFGLDNNDIIELLQKQEDLGFTPGSKYSYSNSNYIILAKIIESVSGQNFNSYSKTFFKKLEMNTTSFVEKYMKVIPNRANPYSTWGNTEWLEVPTVTKTNGEGFLFTTLKDQLIYEQLIQNAYVDDNKLLIQSQLPIPNSEIKTYGFGLELQDILGHKCVYHAGGTFGFHSQTYRFPKEKLTIFIMSNNGDISSNLIGQEIAKILLPTSNNKASYDKMYYQKNDNESINVLGNYIYPNEDSMVQIIKKGNKIYWQEKKFTVEIFSEGKNKYASTNNSKIKIVFYPNEMMVFYTSGKTKTFKKQIGTPVTVSDFNNLVGTYHNSELDASFEMKFEGEKTLKLKFSDDQNFENVLVYNSVLMSSDNYFLKVQKDAFDRVTEILLSYGRALNMRFKKKTHFQYQPKVKAGDGSIQVTTIPSKNGNTSDILLTKNYKNGNEIWFKRFGGSSYDKANSILNVEDGYIIVGSTSSYGNGNYDMFVIKTDKKGNKLWQKTYGGFYNEYGYSAEKTNVGYIIKRTKQSCENNTDIHRKCKKNVWFVTIDKNGNEINNQILEPVN